MIAFHLARAAELDPDPERSRAAFDATTQASGYATRRGAVARAQELLEQAARFAPDQGRRIESLKAASELALRRLRGDDAFRLMIEAAEAGEEAGTPADAAQWYAKAVEIGSRMAGISGRFDEAYLQELLERAERLAPDPTPGLRIHLNLNRVWIPWSNGRHDEMAEPADEALVLARQTGDALLLSSALDAASAARWGEGRYSEAGAMSRERIDLLAQEPPSRLVEVERGDAINMLSKALIRSGNVREALQLGRAQRTGNLGHGPPHRRRAGDRADVPARRVGQGDRERNPRCGRAGTPRAGRRSRRSRRTSPRWRRFLGCAATRPPIGTGMRLRPRSRARATNARACGCSPPRSALHLGELDRAAELIDDRSPGFWWRETGARPTSRDIRDPRPRRRGRGARARRRAADRRPFRRRSAAPRRGDPRWRRGPDARSVGDLRRDRMRLRGRAHPLAARRLRADRAAETFAKLGALEPR